MRREARLCLTAIVCIARPYMVYSAELIMKCLNVLRANSLPFYVIKFYLVSEVVFEKGSFDGCKQQ